MSLNNFDPPSKANTLQALATTFVHYIGQIICTLITNPKRESVVVLVEFRHVAVAVFLFKVQKTLEHGIPLCLLLFREPRLFLIRSVLGEHESNLFEALVALS